MDSYAMRQIDRSLQLTASLIRLVMFNTMVIDRNDRDNTPVSDLCKKMLKELEPFYVEISDFDDYERNHSKMYTPFRIQMRRLSVMRTTLRRVCEIYGVDHKPRTTQYFADSLFQ